MRFMALALCVAGGAALAAPASYQCEFNLNDAIRQENDVLNVIAQQNLELNKALAAKYNVPYGRVAQMYVDFRHKGYADNFDAKNFWMTDVQRRASEAAFLEAKLAQMHLAREEMRANGASGVIKLDARDPQQLQALADADNRCRRASVMAATGDQRNGIECKQRLCGPEAQRRIDEWQRAHPAPEAGRSRSSSGGGTH